ncbi:hypothetical protein GGD41_001530 [Paraburkholderia bryophila]|uniref:Uncharacterized protein n=1 Tax=Paraburkholderia bryophila TaxID=420952 RepID=A0A7Z0AZG5_9BURK|nr:hypothetical protein [Paraburkholderia bryophila]
MRAWAAWCTCLAVALCASRLARMGLVGRALDNPACFCTGLSRQFFLLP